jgi:hypothetical protein
MNDRAAYEDGYNVGKLEGYSLGLRDAMAGKAAVTPTEFGNCLGCGAPLVRRALRKPGDSALRCSNPKQPCCA